MSLEPMKMWECCYLGQGDEAEQRVWYVGCPFFSWIGNIFFDSHAVINFSPVYISHSKVPTWPPTNQFDFDTYISSAVIRCDFSDQMLQSIYPALHLHCISLTDLARYTRSSHRHRNRGTGGTMGTGPHFLVGAIHCWCPHPTFQAFEIGHFNWMCK